MVSDQGDGIPVSIKVRVTSGCYCRSCCRSAWQQIDAAFPPRTLATHKDFVFIEHESGPEIIVYLAVTTAGLALAKSIVDLITTIVKARADGARKGDRQHEPLELIVRRVDKDDELQEKLVLRIEKHDSIDRQVVNDHLVKALEKLSDEARGSRQQNRNNLE
jgi:hypothetical protein